MKKKVIIIILIILASIIALYVWLRSTITCRGFSAGKEASAMSVIRGLETALDAYNEFYGSYPPTDIKGDVCPCPEHNDKITPSSRNLVKYLSLEGPRKIPFYAFKPEEIDGNGNLRSIVNRGDIFCYRENASVNDTPENKKKKRKMHNVYKFDIYAADGDDVLGGAVKNW